MKWSTERRAKFKATMAAKRENSIKHSPHVLPKVIYKMASGGRLERLHLRTLRVYVAE